MGILRSVVIYSALCGALFMCGVVMAGPQHMEGSITNGSDGTVSKFGTVCIGGYLHSFMITYRSASHEQMFDTVDGKLVAIRCMK